jgi:hypothetical protein
MKLSRLSSVVALAGASVLLTGCMNGTVPVRAGPTYQEAAASQFLDSNRDAIAKLTAGFDLSSIGQGPVLVATVVNVNDLSRSAPLGRTLSEQYASHMAALGFNVKEIKLRGDVFVREGLANCCSRAKLKTLRAATMPRWC